MGNIFRCSKLNILFLFSILTGFLMTGAISSAYGNIFPNVFNEVALMVRVEKLVQKLLKQEKNGNIDKMISIMLDIKGEVEEKTGNAISLEYYLDHVKSDMQKKGYNVPINEWEAFIKRINLKDKRKKHFAEYMEMVLLDPSREFNIEDEKMLYNAKHGHDKINKEENAISLPLTVAFGVTVKISGEFITLLSTPQAKIRGKYLIKEGLSTAVKGGKEGIE